jgi:hypothetical protein
MDNLKVNITLGKQPLFSLICSHANNSRLSGGTIENEDTNANKINIYVKYQILWGTN